MNLEVVQIPIELAEWIRTADFEVEFVDHKEKSFLKREKGFSRSELMIVTKGRRAYIPS